MTGRKGYTLVELLVVAVLAVALLGISAAGYHTWIKSTAVDASTTVLLAELERARAYALARCCATRVQLFDDERGDLVLIERLDPEQGEEWLPVSRTNRLDRTHVEPALIFFRPDGSCCTEADRLSNEADFAEYGMEIQSLPSKSGAAAANRPDPRMVFVNARTGLANISTREEKKEAAQ